MKTARFKMLPLWCAGTYLTWSSLVYFGSLGSESHCWWPLFLDPLIYPLGRIEDAVLQPLLDQWLAPDPKVAPGSVWTLMDRIAGGYYIGVGTLWLWVVGKGLSILAARLWPLPETQEEA